jgi:hypothetical protein
LLVGGARAEDGGGESERQVGLKEGARGVAFQTSVVDDTVSYDRLQKCCRLSQTHRGRIATLKDSPKPEQTNGRKSKVKPRFCLLPDSIKTPLQIMSYTPAQFEKAVAIV